MSYTGTEARHGRPETRYSLTAAPAIEPISVPDVKAHRRLDNDDTSADSLIPLLISMAREYAESITGRKFITQTWQITMDGFPGIIVPPTPFAAVAAWLPTPQPSPEIPIAIGPVTAVASITYLDINGATQTLDPSKYLLDTSGVTQRIAPTYGNQWPDTLPQVGAVTITITVGYGPAATNVPAGIRHWLLLRVGTMFENREEVAILNRGKVEPLPFVDNLLDPYRTPVI